jgi:hypothetical protein
VNFLHRSAGECEQKLPPAHDERLPLGVNRRALILWTPDGDVYVKA